MAKSKRATVTYKTDAEIELIFEGGQIMHRILRELGAMAKPGVTTAELNAYAEQEIAKVGGTPSFKGYGGFPGAICTSVNDGVVHGAPSDLVLRRGDIIKLDIGMKYKGLYTDTAITVGVGPVSDEAQRLMDVTEDSLTRSLEMCIPGNYIGDISHMTQSVAEAAGYSVVRDLVGHGVGYAVHEDPTVPCYGKPKTGLILKPGLVLAVEPMVCMGEPYLEIAPDGYTYRTKDRRLAAHFEHTVAVTKDGFRVLT